MPNGAHFPVQNANYPGFCLVKDNIVNLVVAMYKGRAVFWLCLWVLEEGHHVVLVWYLSYRFPSLLVFGGSLRLGDCVEGCDLAVVETRVLAI